jgi:hypothetical protein
MTCITIKASLVAEFIMRVSRDPALGASKHTPPKTHTPAQAPLSNAKFTPFFSEHLERIWGMMTALTGAHYTCLH